jgi:hypothetical protein
MDSSLPGRTRRLGPLAALGLVLAACTGGTGSVGGAVATAAPTTAPTKAPAAAPSTAPSARMEVEVISAAAPKLDALTAALKSGNLAASHDALEAYDQVWNGVEVYINFRSKPAYDELEGHLQHAIEEGLAAAQPDFAALTTLSEQLEKEYDKAIAMVTAGPAISPLFDDVTRLRMIRSDLRIVNASLGANNVAKAKAHWTTFKSGIGTASDLIKVRSAGTVAELAQAIAAADAAFSGGATAEALTPLAAAVTSRYNFGVGLWNAAARNADASKTTYSKDDLANVATLNDVALQLKRSLAAWKAGDFAGASKGAAAAGTAFATVQPKLAAHNGADVAMKTALAAYADLAKAAGDAAKVSGANRTALETVAVAHQVFVGQFWTDKALQDILSAFPTS